MAEFTFGIGLFELGQHSGRVALEALAAHQGAERHLLDDRHHLLDDRNGPCCIWGRQRDQPGQSQWGGLNGGGRRREIGGGTRGSLLASAQGDVGHQLVGAGVHSEDASLGADEVAAAHHGGGREEVGAVGALADLGEVLGHVGHGQQGEGRFGQHGVDHIGQPQKGWAA